MRVAIELTTKWTPIHATNDFPCERKQKQSKKNAINFSQVWFYSCANQQHETLKSKTFHKDNIMNKEKWRRKFFHAHLCSLSHQLVLFFSSLSSVHSFSSLQNVSKHLVELRLKTREFSTSFHTVNRESSLMEEDETKWRKNGRNSKNVFPLQFQRLASAPVSRRRHRRHRYIAVCFVLMTFESGKLEKRILSSLPSSRWNSTRWKWKLDCFLVASRVRRLKLEIMKVKFNFPKLHSVHAIDSVIGNQQQF